MSCKPMTPETRKMLHEKFGNEFPDDSSRSAGCFTRDSALQHAGFLADAADRFIRAINIYDAVIGDGILFCESTIEQAEAEKSESFRALQSAIYEFRKRCNPCF